MSDWKIEVPQKDGWYWFRPLPGSANKPSPYRLIGGRLLVVAANSTFDIGASMLGGEWNHKEIKVPK